MMPQKEEFIYFPISGIEVLDILLTIAYMAAAIAIIIISLRSNMTTTNKAAIVSASLVACIYAIKKSITFLGVFEYIHFRTSIFAHPWGVKKLTLYQSMLTLQTNTFSWTATILLACCLAAIIIRGYPRN